MKKEKIFSLYIKEIHQKRKPIDFGIFIRNYVKEKQGLTNLQNLLTTSFHGLNMLGSLQSRKITQDIFQTYHVVTDFARYEFHESKFYEMNLFYIDFNFADVYAIDITDTSFFNPFRFVQSINPQTIINKKDSNFAKVVFDSLYMNIHKLFLELELKNFHELRKKLALYFDKYIFDTYGPAGICNIKSEECHDIISYAFDLIEEDLKASEIDDNVSLAQDIFEKQESVENSAENAIIQSEDIEFRGQESVRFQPRVGEQ